MGHGRIAGEVLEETRFGFTFMRVDVPETSEQPAFSQSYNPSSIYRINWTTEEVARKFAENINMKPVQVYDIKEAARKMMLTLNPAREPDLTDLEEERDELEDRGIFDDDYDNAGNGRSYEDDNSEF